MIKKVVPVLLFSLLFLLPGMVQAQEVSAPKYSNEFLNLGIGARALGMGGVQSAIVRDVTAGFWNPSGLVHMPKRHNASYMYSELFAGIIKNDFGSYATKLDSTSALAFSVIRVGVDDIADTRRLQNEYGATQYDSIEFFSVADYAFIASYARTSNLIQGLSLGANAKIIYRNVGNFANAWGFGIDAGAQLQRGQWQFGVMAKDITTTFTAWKLNPEELEDAYLKDQASFNANSIEITLPRLTLGVGRSFQLTDRFSALIATDLDFTLDGKRNTLLASKVVSVDPKVGFEIGYANSVFLRGGLNNIQQFQDFSSSDKSWKMQPNFGIGVATHGLMLDLALTKVADNSQVSSVIVSVGYSFD